MPSIVTKLEALEGLIPTLLQQYHRLILVVGRHGVGKTRLLKELLRAADERVEAERLVRTYVISERNVLLPSTDSGHSI